jgi:hypothetical protein
MVNIIILIAFILYFGYNIIQVSEALTAGAPSKEMFKLFLFAAVIDLFALLKK